MSTYFPAAGDIAPGTLATDPHSTLHGDLGDALSDRIEALGLVDLTGYSTKPTTFNPASTNFDDDTWIAWDWANGQYHFGWGAAVAPPRVSITAGDGVADTTWVTSGNPGYAWIRVEDETKVFAQLQAAVGQTDPILDLQDSAGVHVFMVAPDGKVGGTTPSDGDQLSVGFRVRDDPVEGTAGMNPAVLLKLLYDLQAQLMDAQVTITEQAARIKELEAPKTNGKAPKGATVPRVEKPA